MLGELGPSGGVDRRIDADVTSVGEGEPIVLVPGVAGGSRLLVPLAKRLARFSRVILVDLPGERGSPGQRLGLGIDDLAGDLARTIGRLGLERPTVFGVSFGGAVALQFAADFPGLCGGLVLYGADRRFEHARMSEVARHVLERFPLPSNHPFLNQFFNLLHGRKPEAGSLTDFIIRRCWATDQAVVADRLRALADYDLGDRAGLIETPALVIAGLRDVVARPARQEVLAAALGEARFRMIEGAGHVGFLTHRAEVAKLVHAFINRRARVAGDGR